MMSIEKARDKLADYNVLLKHMSFLQSNGFSDCGRGQIIGQIALLQEYLIEECGDEQKQDKGIDRGKKIHGICNCHGNALRTCGTRKAGCDRSTGRRLFVQHAWSSMRHDRFGRSAWSPMARKRQRKLKSKNFKPSLCQ